MFDILGFQKQKKQNIVTEVIPTRNLCTLIIYNELVQIDKKTRTVAERNAKESGHVINWPPK